MRKQNLIVKIILLNLLTWSSWVFGQEEYYGRYLCAYPQVFTCVNVKPGDTWKKLFPDVRDREIVKRLNRTNIPLSYRSWIVIPKHIKELNYLNLSPFPLAINSRGEKEVLVDLKQLAFAAYDVNGKLVHWGPAVGGRDWCDDINRPCHTALGTYHIYDKQGPDCVSSKFPIDTDGGAPMPFCMHYYNGFALHGSPTVPGYNASHGCVRLFEEDAQWLNEKFTKIGTRVVVKSEE